MLIVVGMMSLFSIDHGTGSGHFKKQLFRLGIGVVPFLIMLNVRPIKWRQWSWGLYGVNLAMLVIVLVAGRTRGGAQRWLEFGPLDLQPSEVSKILVILTLATFYYNRREAIDKLSTFGLAFLHVAIPMALIFKQPHLGATLVILCIFFAISMVAGVPWKYICGAIVAAFGLAVIAVKVPGVLDAYQMERINGLLNPDDKTNGFQALKALMAFGSGGMTGTGYLRGELVRGSFVPEQESDFILTVMGEEGGLVGCFLVLCLFGTLFTRLWWSIYRSQDLFHQMVIAGILAVFVAHTFANLGSILRILPVVGLWLPFMSAGGTALWLCMSLVALALNIKNREDEGEMFAGPGISKL